MILVTLGTFNIEFQRPLRAIEKAVIEKKVTEKIIVQRGHTNFSSEYLEVVQFFAPAELDKLYDEARIVVVHSGIGSVLSGVRKGKKLIVVPRLKKYKEHVDDHQLDLLNEFARSGYIIPWNENETFEDVLAKAENFVPKPFVSTKEKLVGALIDYIEKI
ncbi:MAG TPA: PssE/Cps14G family polysaccharide biosynthesis glycosyltransferase [Parafilimonas sp.]|nr:PssE/Cps14G family polysaccharide biosynthesis glycosyltransferase [Parafilimonas sp.]